jgi:acetyltransferase-like isoleucine patch superfamily enzyme
MIKKIKRTVGKMLTWYYALKGNINVDDYEGFSFRVLKNCGKYCKFSNQVYCSGNVYIGRYTSINGPGTRIHSRINKIIIGNFCSIAPNVSIQETNHKFDRVSTYFIEKNILRKKIRGKPIQMEILL